MRQILQNLQTGETELAEVPCPRVKRGYVLIQTRRSLISTGTERMLVSFARANLLQKAQQQPQRIRQVIDKVRTDGLSTTLRAVRAKLAQPLPLGYCNVGVVIDVGAGVAGFAVGDRVVSNGPHAEVVSVPQNLCARIPDDVSFDDAVFTVAAAIGLQGVRLIQPTLGESFVVTGLGLIGLLTAQLLRAHGCRVLGVEIAPDKLALAARMGIDAVDANSAEAAALEWTSNRGVDGVVITASTHSSAPVHQAAQMCRKRGRIVLVGVTGLELQRADFYEKELTFQVSCSYGPGRYDATYEEQGLDYPIGLVRWTEQRNFEAVLEMLAQKRLDTQPLISEHYPLAQAIAAYDRLEKDDETLALLLDYPEEAPARLRRQSVAPTRSKPSARRPGAASVGVIGAGNYAIQVLLPALKKTAARLHTVASSGGRSGLHAARTFGFERTTTDTEALLDDPEIDTVFVLTRHNSHPGLVSAALDRGKNVFVEKPLAIDIEGLEQVESAYLRAQENEAPPLLMVGFNRRFAPHVQAVKKHLSAEQAPAVFIMTVNAGALPANHWTQDPAVGGGRLIGEGCHFIDLLRYLSGAPITGHQITTLGGADDHLLESFSVTLTFASGAMGTIHYLSNGHRASPKERLDIFCGGKIFQLDNFRSLQGFGWPGIKRQRRWSQDKGHAAGVAAFIDAVRVGGAAPIPFEELLEVTRVSFDLVASARRSLERP